MVSAVINVNEVLEGHVELELDCLDRIYLNAYVPRLQTSGQVAVFMTDHLGLPFPSPAIFEKISNRFRHETCKRSPRATGYRSCGWPRRIAAAGMTASSIMCRAIWPERSVGVDPGSGRRRRPAICVGVDRPGQPRQQRQVPLAVRQGPLPGDRLLFLHLRPGLRPGVHQDHVLLPLSGQVLAERPRVAQTPSHQSGPGLRAAGQRFRLL